MMQTAGLPPYSERRELALEEIVGTIAARVLAIMNVACSGMDLEALRNEMGKLHRRTDQLAAMFASEPDIQRHIRAIGQLGGAAVSIAPRVPMQLFEKFTEETEALNLALAERQTRWAKDNNTKTVQPIALPPDTKWEDITIRFLTGHDVRIEVAGRVIAETDYKRMGFENRHSRMHVPNVQWELLQTLAQNNRQIAPGDMADDPRVKKRKQLLAKGLKEYFPIDGDPFYPYRKVGAYKIRINLIPD
jgi:hypothetical protein